MTIVPISKSVEVNVPPARAFELFTVQIGRWWPRGKTVGQQPHEDIVIEPFAGGRWFERDATGLETQWGHVMAWEPPSRLLLAWQLNAGFSYDPVLVTEVELTFAARDGGGTLVRLEHRHLERLGVDAPRVAESINRGWGARLGDYAAFANAPVPSEVA